MGEPTGRRKRVHRPRKIVPRGRMGPQWAVGALILAGLIALAGVVFLLTRAR